MTAQPKPSPLNPETDLDPAALAAWRDMVRDLRVAGASSRTLETYGQSLAQLARHHAGAELLALTRAQISDYLIHVGTTRSPATRSVRFRSLRRFYGWAEAEEIIPASPMAKMPAQLPVHKAPRVLDAAELGTLLRACAGKGWAELRDTAMVLLWSEPGSPRVSEMTGLTLDDVDLARDVVLIRGKGRRERLIKMGPETARAMSRWMRARAGRPHAAATAAVFLGTKGEMTRSGAQQMLARRARAAGMGRVHPHQLRHTSTDRALRAGMTERDCARLMGHANTRMMEVYGRQAADRAALEAAARVSITTGLAARR